MSTTDELVANNAAYARQLRPGRPRLPPRQKVAVLACMDARLDPAKALGLQEGDAHVIRNAGGVATDDAIRSLVISQRLLGTEEIILIHHTDCGMETFSDDAVKAQIEADTGLRPAFALEAFPDAEADVRQTAARIQASPFVPSKSIRGFVYDVHSGKLQEVAARVAGLSRASAPGWNVRRLASASSSSGTYRSPRDHEATAAMAQASGRERERLVQTGAERGGDQSPGRSCGSTAGPPPSLASVAMAWAPSRCWIGL